MTNENGVLNIEVLKLQTHEEIHKLVEKPVGIL